MDKKASTMNLTIQMENPSASVSMGKIFNEDNDDTLTTKTKPVVPAVHVADGSKQNDENDDSNVPLATMTKQADIKGRALNLTNDASFVHEMAHEKAVEMINYVTTQSSVMARGMEDLSDVSMDDDDDDSVHDVHINNEATIDVNECIDNGRRYKVRDNLFLRLKTKNNAV